MPADPKELFSLVNDPKRHGSYGGEPLSGILFRLKSGERLLLPHHEITGVSVFPQAGGGRVEIHARHQLIQLAMTSIEACNELLDLIHSGAVNQITEGTGPIRAPDTRESRTLTKEVTLVIEIRNLDAPGGTGSPPLPNPVAPAPRVGLGFPSM